MNRTLAISIAFAATLMLPLAAAGAESGHMPMHGMTGQSGGMMMGQGGAAGQGGMMGCPMMSGMMGRGIGGGMGGGHGMMGGRGLPALPPGNEKLQLQMHAEIMQKVGEIIAKYANQIQTR